MKKLIATVMLTLMTMTAAVAIAADDGGGGTGGGNFDCARCVGQGGIGAPAHYVCQQTEYGSISGCQGGANGCSKTGGCVSLPDDDGGGLHP